MTNRSFVFLIVYSGCLYTFAAGIIDCYVCSTKNNSNRACNDPFHPEYTNLSVACRQGMEGRYGLFPARYCIKMKGTSHVDGAEMIMRYCALDTLDTMCGMFKYEDVAYTGCIASCNKRACNGSTKPEVSITWIVSAILLLYNQLCF